MFPCCCQSSSSSSSSLSSSQGGQFPTIPACSGGLDYPQYWELVIAGLANGTCGDCISINSILILEYGVATPSLSPAVTGCSWGYRFSLSGCGGSVFANENTVSLYSQNALPPNRISFFLNDFSGTGITYTLSGVFDRAGANTFNQLNTGGGFCTNWPASITIEPYTP